MLREQLSKLKKKQQIHEIRPKTNLHFSNSEHLDDETLYEMITIDTEYTSQRYKYFNRYKLTKPKERSFNQKFKKYLKELIVHNKNTGFCYLLDFLVRNFYVDIFNAEELIFIILPFRHYESQLRILSEKVSFLCNFTNYSHCYFARLMIKDVYFFDFFMQYFGYYEIISDFIDDVVNELCVLNGYNRVLPRLYALLNLLKQNKKIDLFHKLYTSIEKECDLNDDFLILYKGCENITSAVEDSSMQYCTNRVKVDCIKEDKINVYSIIEQLKGQKQLKIENISSFLGQTSDIKILLEFLVSRLDKNEITNLLYFISVSDVRFINEYITTENISKLLEIHTDTVLYFLPRNFVSINKHLIFCIIVEQRESNFKCFSDFIAIDDIEQYKYETEISRVNLIKICRLKGYDCKDIIFNQNIFDANTLTFILTSSLLTDVEFKNIFSCIKNLSNEYIDVLFLNKIDSKDVCEDFLYEVIDYFTKKDYCLQLIVNIIENNFDKDEKVRKLALEFIENKSDAIFASLVQKIIENDLNYCFDLFAHNFRDILTELLQRVDLEKLYRHDNDVFVKNFRILRDCFLKININIFDNENVVLMNNIRLFVCKSIDNAGTLLPDLAESFVTTNFFYINLFFTMENDISRILIEEGIDKHESLYDKIFEIIVKDINKFYLVYFDIYLKISKTYPVDYNLILNNVKNQKPDISIKPNFNIFLKDLLTKKKIEYIYLDTIINYCDEFNLSLITKTYKNMLVPYLDNILVQFVDVEMITKCLFELEGIEVLKSLTRVYSISLNKKYIELITLFFQNNTDNEYNLIVKYFIHNSNMFLQYCDLIASFLAYSSLNNIPQDNVQTIIDHYSREDILTMFSYILKHDNTYFRDYIEDCFIEVINKDFSHIELITLFLNGTQNFIINHKSIDNSIMVLMDQILSIGDSSLLNCLSSLLNYSKEKMKEVNILLLKKIKNESDVSVFEILNHFYMKVEDYKLCIRDSVPYFSLFMDHKDGLVQGGVKDLLVGIEKWTGENPYNYFE